MYWYESLNAIMWGHLQGSCSIDKMWVMRWCSVVCMRMRSCFVSNTLKTILIIGISIISIAKRKSCSYNHDVCRIESSLFSNPVTFLPEGVVRSMFIYCNSSTSGLYGGVQVSTKKSHQLTWTGFSCWTMSMVPFLRTIYLFYGNYTYSTLSLLNGFMVFQCLFS